MHRADELPAADDGVIQRVPCAEDIPSAQVFHAQHHAVLDPGIALQERVDHVLPFLAFGLEQEAQPALVDAQNGDTARCAQLCRPQHGPVSAYGGQQVELTLLDLLPQVFVIERPVRRVEALALEIL